MCAPPLAACHRGGQVRRSAIAQAPFARAGPGLRQHTCSPRGRQARTVTRPGYHRSMAVAVQMCDAAATHPYEVAHLAPGKLAVVAA